MTPATPRFFSAGSTDQGFVRENNEDRILVDDEHGYFLVVDGMGGHEAGEHAAAIAVDTIKARLDRQTDTVEQRLREAITLANNAIFEAASNRKEWKGMACVLTAAVIENGTVYIGHVGDSRLYRIKRGLIEKITHDHSPVGEREDAGEITEAEAMKHPRRNEVYRDVGSEEHTPDDDDFIDILKIDFETDSALLLCSDGLSDAISSQEILSIVEKHAADRQLAVKTLIEAATEVGKDNVSVILVEGEKFAASYRKRRPAKPKHAIVTDPQTPPPAVPTAPAKTAGIVTARTSTAAPTPVIIETVENRPSWTSIAMALLLGLLLGAAGYYLANRYLIPPPAPATRTIRVAAPDTISAALAQARPGDTISVEPGTYTEAVHLKDGVDLVARRPHDAVIEGFVTADNVHRGRFDGFRVHGASDAAIRLHDSDLTLERVEVSGATGAGIVFTGNSRGAVVACWIHDNAGAGIELLDSAAPAIENSLIISNGAGKTARPGLLIHSSAHPRVTSNIFLSNEAEAVWLPQADTDIIDRNYFNVSGKPDRRPRFRVIAPVEARQ